MEQSKKFKFGFLFWGLLLSGLVIAYVIFLWISSRKGQNKITSAKQTKLIQSNSDLLGDATNEQVIMSFVAQVIPEINPLIIMAISAHETNNFTSTVYHNNNNLFGMRMPKSRETTALGDTNADGYANYANIEDSIEDFVLWFQSNGLSMSFTSTDEIVTAMHQHKYFEASLAGYKKAVKARFDNLNSRYA